MRLLSAKVISEFFHITLLHQTEFTFTDDNFLSCIHNGLAIGRERTLKLLSNAGVLSLCPFVDVAEARRTLCNLWRFHLDLWHIKANISYIVVVHLFCDGLQLGLFLFEFLLLVSQLRIAVRDLLIYICLLLVVLCKRDFTF